MVGSNVLRAYMHGFFIDTELYDKVALIANPDAYKDEREREIRRRIEKERESRIRTSGAVVKPKIKVNRTLVDRLSQKRGDTAVEKVLTDDRFKEMFEDEEFQVDEDAYDYKQLNPVKSAKETEEGAAKRIRALTAAEESDEERIAIREGKYDSDRNSSDEESESDEEERNNDRKDEEVSEKEKKSIQKQLKSIERRKKAKKQSDEFMGEMSVGTVTPQEKDVGKVTFADQVKDMTEEEREKKSDGSILHRNHRGEAELTFVPQKKKQIKKPKKRVEFEEGEEDEEAAKNNGRSRPRNEGRRRASKNVFRGM